MRMFLICGPKAKYNTMNWWQNFMSGHINLGKKTTIYGSNAMCWVVTIRTKKWGYICFTLPSISKQRRREGMYFYLSPNGTPWACTYYRGRDKLEKIKSQLRKYKLGHNFDAWNCEESKLQLTKINNIF